MPQETDHQYTGGSHREVISIRLYEHGDIITTSNINIKLSAEWGLSNICD